MAPRSALDVRLRKLSNVQGQSKNQLNPQASESLHFFFTSPKETLGPIHKDKRRAAPKPAVNYE
jgi:dsDNA-binding SOS-regulon protein